MSVGQVESGRQQNHNLLLIRAAIATIVGLLAGVAFVELAPRYFPDIAMEPAQYRFLEIHLALNAMLLAGAAYYIKMVGHSEETFRSAVLSFLIYTSLWGLTFVNVVLAGKSLYAMDVEKIWIALLALPAVVNFFAAPAMRDEWEEEDPDDTFDDKLDYDDDAFAHELESAQPVPESDDWNGSAFAIWWDHFFSAIFRAANYAFYILLFEFGLFYYSVLDALLFSGRDLSLGGIINDAPAAFSKLLPYLIAAPIVIAVLTIVVGLCSATYYSYLKLRYPMMDRKPSTTEIDYIENAHQHLESYFENRQYPRVYGFLLNGGGLVLSVAWIGVMGTGSAWLASHLPSIFESERTANTIVYLYGNITSLIPAAIGVFAGIFMMGATFQAAGHFAPRFAEYAYVSGWNTVHGRDRTPDDYLEAIIQSVRMENLRTDQPFDPPAFLLSAFKEFEKLIYSAALALLIINAGVLFLNVQYFHLFAEDRIEYSDYATTQSYRIDYEDVREVRLSCYAYSNGAQRIGHAYKVVLDDTHMIDLFAGSRYEREDLAAFRTIDQKLRKAQVPFVHEDASDWPNKNKTALGDHCRDVLVNKYPVETGSVIANLLRADGCYPMFYETNFCTKKSF